MIRERKDSNGSENQETQEITVLLVEDDVEECNELRIMPTL